MVQTSAIATGVAIIGSTKIVRATPRNGKFLAKHTAAQMPSAMGTMTAAAVKYNVRATGHVGRLLNDLGLPVATS